MIRPMQLSDVDEVVDVHLKAFRSFFLTYLGPRFLRLLYREIALYEDGIAFIYTGEAGIKGFVAGTICPADFYKYLLRTQWFRFGWNALGPAVRRPEIVPRLLRAFFYPRMTSDHRDSAMLMSIGIDPRAQGNGAGQQLVTSFLDEARRRGANRVNLITDRQNNDAANAFYQQMGFYREQAFTTPEGREMNEYVVDVRSFECSQDRLVVGN